MRLKDYCTQNDVSYPKAWRLYNSGKIKGYKDENGVINIGEKSEVATVSVSNGLVITNTLSNDYQPMSTSLYEEKAATRTNKSASIRPTDRYKNIDDGIIPVEYSASGNNNNSDISITDMVVLCQKAYFNFSVVRNTIDLMSEFCVGEIHFREGSSKSRLFFKNYFKKLNIWSIQDMFFREFFRSGNVFIYRIEGKISPGDIKKINQTFGFEIKADEGELPIRFIILNPADIHAHGSISFSNASYYKVLSGYELERLKNARTPEDKEVLETLSPEEREKIKNKRSGTVYIELNNKNIVAIFYKRQSYEVFAVSPIYPVLQDLNFRQELRLMDVAIARTAQQIILLVKNGNPPDKGGINKKTIETLAQFFESESLCRVLVADYSTTAEFVIPQIADILDPKKFEVIDRDIAIGLNNVLIGQGEKFANQHSKIEIFIERLKHARQSFLNEFLIPEIKRIAQNIGLKNFPEPFYEDLDLKDELEYAKIYTRLCELGILTADETLTAINDGVLPSKEDSIVNQTEYKKLRDKEFYKPLMMKEAEGAGAGRTPGTKAPKSKVSVGPIGGSEENDNNDNTIEAKYSLKKITENMILAQKLEDNIQTELKTKHKLKKLNKSQLEIAAQITETIILNEGPENWETKINEYLENPMDKNKERLNEILEIGAEHRIQNRLAGILFVSKI